MQILDVNYSPNVISEKESFTYKQFISELVVDDYVFNVKGIYTYEEINMPFNIEVKRIPKEEFTSTMIPQVFFHNRNILDAQILVQLRLDNPIIKEEIKEDQEVKKNVLLNSQLLDVTKEKLVEKALPRGKKKS